MICALFIALAGICKAVADTLTHHFDTSVFKWKDKRWWDPAISHQHVEFIRFTKYRADAWHLANTGMILFLLCAVAFPSPLPWWVVICGGGTLFILVFNLFYNKVLINKKPLS